ncbi:hypothetical protein IW261DRAFT_1635678 [Armillaria novae-zelandiae]|uniref:Uncharacterized protein n=1 Tax=Armillaria novae-zelandiae TaxID=153914 RepID=A0AA39P4B3_9AGAR|nr:hypothetical protein IW261DRAFT_1635678 [Armillaria novae-zelandiae]
MRVSGKRICSKTSGGVDAKTNNRWILPSGPERSLQVETIPQRMREKVNSGFPSKVCRQVGSSIRVFLKISAGGMNKRRTRAKDNTFSFALRAQCSRSARSLKTTIQSFTIWSFTLPVGPQNYMIAIFLVTEQKYHGAGWILLCLSLSVAALSNWGPNGLGILV